MISDINKIICGDNLSVLKEIPPESVDLVYLDPPFFSGKKYEVIWGDNDEVRSFSDTSKHFEEQNKLNYREFTNEEKEYYKRNSGGMSHYLIWMKDRLELLHQVLKPTGSIYLHCDWHASHYLKIEMDKIFGYNNFQTEIIWNYRRYSQSSVKGKRFEHTHDCIFHYTKTDDYKFNPIFEAIQIPISAASKNGFVKDGGGWFKTAPTGQGTGGYSDKTIAELDTKGLIHWTKNGKARKKYYCDTDGINILDKKMLGNVWVDVPDMMHVSKTEVLGYPTQKPEALLERIIKASSNEGDIVLDPFCGCGTTVAVAKRLNRKFIGIDISPKSCKVIAKRIGYDEVDIVGLPMKIEDLIKMESHEFQQWVCDKMIAKNTSSFSKLPSGPDKGIDGIVVSNIMTGGYGGSLIQVKQSNGVGINTIKNLFATMYGRKIKNGFVVALSFSNGAIEQVAKYKLENNVNIKLVIAQSLCKLRNYNYKSDIISTGEMKEEDFWMS